MEENKDDIIYDLESAEAAEEQGAQSPDGSESSENSESSDGSENSDSSENSDGSDSSDSSDPARAELDRMVKEMGAETLLDIIRDNRNAAIRQIISEVEASGRRPLQSGTSAARGCTSIFDLAALA